MSNENLINEAKAKINEKIAAYNAELASENPRKNELDSIEAKVKDLCSDLRKTMLESKLNELVAGFANPMLEAARIYKISTPSYRLAKNDGVVTSMESDEKYAVLDPVALTKILAKYSAKDGFVQTGVFQSGAAWAARAEKLAFLLSLKVGRDIGFDKDAQKAFESSYRMTEIAKKEAMGQTPTSTSQIVKLLQTVVDAMVWVDNPKFKDANLVKCESIDASWLMAIFTRHGRQEGGISVAQGKRINSYLFEMLHMIVTGKPYSIEYKAGKDQTVVKLPEKVRDVIPESEKRARPVEDKSVAA